MLANLSWPEASRLAANGAHVRRPLWDRYIFRTAGGLYWLADYAGTYTRVVQALDFQRPEFLARDWTDVDPDQAHCVGLDTGTYTAGEIASPIWEFGLSGTVISSPIKTGTIPNNPWNEPAYLRVHANGLYYRAVMWVGGTQTSISPTYDRGFFDVPANGTFSIRGEIIGRGNAENTLLWQYARLLPPAIDLGNYSPRVVENPFTVAVTVELTGSVSDKLLLNGAVVREGPEFTPVSFILGGGESFTIAARSDRRDFPFFIGYDLSATFTA